MIQADAPFPHIGSTGYVRGTGEARRIMQRNADGSCTVKVLPPDYMTPADKHAWRNRGASLTARVDPAELCATRQEALGARPRRTRSRR